MAKKYKNIPVNPEVYAKVALIAESNGFGVRGLGALISKWAGRELPECEHKKTPVEIEYYPNDNLVAGWRLNRHGFYCATCKRVYEKITPE